MADNHGFYEVYSYGDTLDPGRKMSIEHSLSFQQDKADISQLTALSIGELQSQRESSIAAEKMLFENLREATKPWEAQAAKTMLLDKAIEYVNTRAAEHSANKWGKNEYDHHSVSNMVYKMSYHVYEDTKYDRATQKSVPVAWYLTWSVRTNAPDNRYGGSIAGQDRKRFTDKAAMEKYMSGRIKAYSHLFTEISPPIPREYANEFCVNGRLLPGYTVEGQEVKPPESDAKQKFSVMDKLAAAKDAAKAQSGAEKPDKPKKSHGVEL